MNIDRLIETLINGRCISERDLKLICYRAIEIFLEESNVQQPLLMSVVTFILILRFVRIIQGRRRNSKLKLHFYWRLCRSRIQFSRDYRIFTMFKRSRIILILVKYPGNILLLRGNHECRSLTQIYGFYEEVLNKYGNCYLWRLFMEVFDLLPLAAIIEGSIFCIDRKMEIPNEGAICDLMWSDPEDIDYWSVDPRGAGYLFGAKVTKEFSRINDLTLICRAHQLAIEGYKYWFPVIK